MEWTGKRADPNTKTENTVTVFETETETVIVNLNLGARMQERRAVQSGVQIESRGEAGHGTQDVNAGGAGVRRAGVGGGDKYLSSHRHAQEDRKTEYDRCWAGRGGVRYQ